jgi:hypothetical protein
MILQIATALAIGAYVVLSKDAQHKRLDASPRESLNALTDTKIRDARVSEIGQLATIWIATIRRVL